MEKDLFKIGNLELKSRLITGTGKFSSKSIIPKMLESSESEMITVALRRVNNSDKDGNILNYIPKNVMLLPNTSGARDHMEAVRIARIAKEAGCGNFIKIEIINDMKYLLPNNEETLKATEILAKEGFHVMPYIMPDLIISKRLESAGAAAVMPLGAPIGTNKGLLLKDIIEIIIENVKIPVIVDAGIGKPSHAAAAMEIGAAAVIVNTAIATSEDPILMGEAFKYAVKSGRMGYLAKMAEEKKYADASSPLTGFLGD